MNGTNTPDYVLREALQKMNRLTGELQAENARLLQAVADGGIRAGELTAKVIDLERRLRVASRAGWAFASRLNRDAAGSMMEPTYEDNCDALRAACDLNTTLKEE